MCPLLSDGPLALWIKCCIMRTFGEHRVSVRYISPPHTHTPRSLYPGLQYLISICITWPLLCDKLSHNLVTKNRIDRGATHSPWIGWIVWSRQAGSRSPELQLSCSGWARRSPWGWFLPDCRWHLGGAQISGDPSLQNCWWPSSNRDSSSREQDRAAMPDKVRVDHALSL